MYEPNTSMAISLNPFRILVLLLTKFVSCAHIRPALFLSPWSVIVETLNPIWLTAFRSAIVFALTPPPSISITLPRLAKKGKFYLLNYVNDSSAFYAVTLSPALTKPSFICSFSWYLKISGW